ncbi:EG45-like domain containing protein [Quercus suber]|nr:EG45-like domain containing protein [Quercus suber]POE82494.1 eg45-like domain containing protein [Quercus suber]
MALSDDVHVPCTGKMHRSLPLLQRLALFSLVVLFFLHTCCYGDVGTAARYAPPYLPTTCYGSDTSEFPSSNLFAASGEGIWDNGAACGRQYLVRCISASLRHACALNQTIQIKIVDYIQGLPSPPSARNTTMILSSKAFGAIANLTTNSPAINIEFQQV